MYLRVTVINFLVAMLIFWSLITIPFQSVVLICLAAIKHSCWKFLTKSIASHAQNKHICITRVLKLYFHQ